ncbi:hypothetical protein [Stenotrophomonas sp. CFBP 13725]|uniref:hypothetical protein n=1 Tax=Stenotrophomonas sp. CFBP 13725 TaxID=2775297 RepID=UPI00178177AB|nr:hypothetical protein [Stenotrophomonas sp. CFBP 13725]MBD8635644.1 hypothetical protein [Stenotrophomonas sp. CFBP 13725]
MTQCQIDNPEGLSACAAGHSARHIHVGRCANAGGGHFVECRCKKTAKLADPDAALGGWRQMNRPARSARKVVTQVEPVNVLQFKLTLADPATKRTRVRASAQGGRP